MPDPPSVSPITQYLFDNPWPLVMVLGLLAVVFGLGWRSVRRRELLIFAGIAVVLAVGVFILERAVTTSGERAEVVVRDLVAAAEQGNVQAGLALFSGDATMSLVDPRNPGVGIDEIARRLRLVTGRYAIKSNAITSLKAYSEDSDRGVVHLRVRSEFESGYGFPVSSAWVIAVERQADNTWKVGRITFIEFNGQSPTVGVFR